MAGKPRRTQAERSDATRAKLIATARELFAERGYADTTTPEIVDAAGVTRGALYHHFADKPALFRAVVTAEDQAVAEAIEKASADDDPLTALVSGGTAFVAAMADPGRRRILLVDAPAVLGRARMREIAAQHSARTLLDGVAAAQAANQLPPLPPDLLSDMLEALFDRAAEAEDPTAYLPVITALISGLKHFAAPGVAKR